MAKDTIFNMASLTRIAPLASTPSPTPELIWSGATEKKAASTSRLRLCIDICSCPDLITFPERNFGDFDLTLLPQSEKLRFRFGVSFYPSQVTATLVAW